ncbi:MAG: immune inhibitor A [Armatimonadetes bacterium]|nr:immune inhibitor A [Anaerolineae bacterium]
MINSLRKSAQRSTFYLALLLLFTVSQTIGAQEADPRYPTVIALEQAVIPPRDRVALAQALLGVTEIAPPPTQPASYTIGDRQTFRALDTAASRIFEFEAELLGLGEHIAIWVDIRADDVNPEDAQRLADTFDAEIYPGVRDLWGSEPNPGIDGDPRVFALFTFGLGGAAAYFSSDNTYPDEVAPSSNEHEMFIYELGAFGDDLSTRDVQSTTAHEFQHMIRDEVNPNPETWINEGLSVFTEVYLNYPGAGWLAWEHQSAPGTQLNTWAESGSTAPYYGGSMLFMTYFYERFGLKALQTVSRQSSLTLGAFDTVLQDLGIADVPDVDTLFADWVLANWWRDTALADGRYGYLALDQLPAPSDRRFRDYPIEREDDAKQYSVDYYELDDLPAGGTLTVTLDAPATVALVPTALDGWAWYSNRRDNSATTLTQAFDLRDLSAATLDYDVWYWLENEWDYGYVLVSTDDGATWDMLTTPQMTDRNPHGTAYGTGYSGRGDDWQPQQIALDAYAGQQILLRFAVITDDATNQPGMVVDNIAIPELGYSSDFDADDGGWQAEGWVRMDNVLPQQVWVQVSQLGDNGDFSLTRWRYPQDAQAMQTALLPDLDTALLSISPFAPQTTVGIDYTLTVTVE